MENIDRIQFWNPDTSAIEVEAVYGDGAIKWLYENPLGQKVASYILSKSLFSKVYGAYQDSTWSRSEIDRFIDKFEIPMEQYEKGPFRTFNEFFIRQFLPGQREFVSTDNVMPGFAEGRYFAFSSVNESSSLPVKGFDLDIHQLLEKKQWVDCFLGGPAMVARLCPVDYHRFHYPDDGKVVDHYPVGGGLHSVNPRALKFKKDIFITNERVVTILETAHFGRIAYVEVGAMSVGKIVQSHDLSKSFKRGDEKGYFLFGGSTVLIVGEKGKWSPNKVLLDQTSLYQRETLVKLGRPIAECL